MLDMVMPVEETIRSAALAHHLSANIAEAAGPVKRRTTQAIWDSRANPFPDRRREALTWERGASVNSEVGARDTVGLIGHPESGHRLETTEYQLSYYQFFAKHTRR